MPSEESLRYAEKIENIQVVAVEHCYKKVEIHSNYNFIILQVLKWLK